MGYPTSVRFPQNVTWRSLKLIFQNNRSLLNRVYPSPSPFADHGIDRYKKNSVIDFMAEEYNSHDISVQTISCHFVDSTFKITVTYLSCNNLINLSFIKLLKLLYLIYFLGRRGAINFNKNCGTLIMNPKTAHIDLFRKCTPKRELYK